MDKEIIEATCIIVMKSQVAIVQCFSDCFVTSTTRCHSIPPGKPSSVNAVTSGLLQS